MSHTLKASFCSRLAEFISLLSIAVGWGKGGLLLLESSCALTIGFKGENRLWLTAWPSVSMQADRAVEHAACKIFAVIAAFPNLSEQHREMKQIQEEGRYQKG